MGSRQPPYTEEKCVFVGCGKWIFREGSWGASSSNYLQYAIETQWCKNEEAIFGEHCQLGKTLENLKLFRKLETNAGHCAETPKVVRRMDKQLLIDPPNKSNSVEIVYERAPFLDLQL